MDLDRLRARYAADILGSTGVENPRVEAAFAAVPREDFLDSAAVADLPAGRRDREEYL